MIGVCALLSLGSKRRVVNTRQMIRLRCYAQVMTEERPEARALIDEYVEVIKSKIPAMEHGALDSRLEELLNDSSADEDDVIAILRQEFDPERKP
jgi:hypothetical protein